MGIQYLNTYIKKNVTNNAIVELSLETLKNKTIAVDISIYLYKYLAENELIENIYQMLSIFYYYKIYPIFVFDGKPPNEKINFINKKNKEKYEAKIKYNNLKLELDNELNDKKNIIETMSNLKKKFIKLKLSDIEKIKKLIIAFGFTYVQANCEADILCVKLVKKNIAWACLSEDMDMFLYGCKRVIRYFSIINHKAIIYYLETILKDLNMSFKEFKEICILSGTDYNINSNITLYQALEYYKLYKKTRELNFFEWIELNTNYIDNIYYLYHIYYMFMTDQIELKDYNINLKKNNINYNLIKEIMIPEGFIFK